MAAVLSGDGHTLVNSPEEADVLVVNTCGFIRDAKEESISTIFDMIREKEADSSKRIIVTGCLAQRYAKDLFEEMPEVDAFMGVNDYGSINQVVESICGDAEERVIAAGPAPDVYFEIPDRVTEPGAVSAYLRIAEGCDNVCAYCIIPYIRGGYRSRRMEEILEEAEMLASRGAKELILIAQDVTAYGKDLYGRYTLPELLPKLCRIEGIHWIRLLYCYEDSITDDLIRVMKNEAKICRYIDIPLQHVNDGILSDMNRNSTSASIRDTIRRLREAMPDIHIRTTFITGFPGETEDRFDELADFVEEARFERMGVFAFSPEEGTPAAEMDGQLEDEIKDRRKDILMELQRQISLECNQAKIGQTLEVLVEEDNGDGTFSGRTRFDAPEIDDGVIFTAGEKEPAAGEFIRVKITDAFDYDLVGEAVK